jgi:hypothetical protein
MPQTVIASEAKQSLRLLRRCVPRNDTFLWTFTIVVAIKLESTHSTPRSEARGMLRVDTERRFLPRFKNRGLAPSNVSIQVGRK